MTRKRETTTLPAEVAAFLWELLRVRANAPRRGYRMASLRAEDVASSVEMSAAALRAGVLATAMHKQSAPPGLDEAWKDAKAFLRRIMAEPRLLLREEPKKLVPQIESYHAAFLDALRPVEPLPDEN